MRIEPNPVEWDQGAGILEHFQMLLSRFVRNSQDAYDIVQAILVGA